MSLLNHLNAPATTHIYTLSLHDALPISCAVVCALASGCGAPDRYEVAIGHNLRATSASCCARSVCVVAIGSCGATIRSEEHTSELQSQFHLVCRLLLENKKTTSPRYATH